MSRIAITCVALLFATSACVIDNDDDGQGGGGGGGSGGGSGSGSGGGGGGGGGGAVTPSEGRWFYSETTPIQSTCPEAVSNGAGDFAITDSTPTGFRVVPEDGTAPFTCTLTGSDFACAERALLRQDYRPALDAVLEVRATAQGTFSSATRATGEQDATATCQGTQCAALGGPSWPCTLRVSYMIQAF